jgi:hypothetical protein
MRRSGRRLIVLVAVLAGCGGGGGHSPIYSSQQVEAAFKQVGITLRAAHRPAAGHKPKQGPLQHTTILTGGIRGHPHADITVYVFSLAAGEAADLLHALQVKTKSTEEPEHNFAAASGNVVVVGRDIARRDKPKLRAAMKNLSGHT